MAARFNLIRLNDFGPGDSFSSYYPFSIEDFAVNRKNNVYSIVYRESQHIFQSHE